MVLDLHTVFACRLNNRLAWGRTCTHSECKEVRELLLHCQRCQRRSADTLEDSSCYECIKLDRMFTTHHHNCIRPCACPVPEKEAIIAMDERLIELNTQSLPTNLSSPKNRLQPKSSFDSGVGSGGPSRRNSVVRSPLTTDKPDDEVFPNLNQQASERPVPRLAKSHSIPMTDSDHSQVAQCALEGLSSPGSPLCAPFSSLPLPGSCAMRPTSLTTQSSTRSQGTLPVISEDLSQSLVSLPPEVEESYQSIKLQDSFNDPAEILPRQSIICQLDTGHLTPNPVDQFYKRIRDYIPNGELGSGGQGTCYYGVDRQKETSFAWKTNRTPEDAYKMLGECTILSKLSHKHVIGCLGAVNDEPQSIKLFMELAEYGNLRTFFEDNVDHRGNSYLVGHVLQQLLSAVCYLHQNSLLHRDIKGRNILLFENWTCKLTDFGLAVPVNDHSQDNTIKGTHPFLSPEYVKTQQYTFSCDVWSTLAVAVEMMTGQDPWYRHTGYPVYIIGKYSFNEHFNILVPEEELRRQMSVFAEQDESSDILEYFFKGLMQIMKEVFVADHLVRPTAIELLNRDVIRKAQYIFEGDFDDEENAFSSLQVHEPQCEIQERSDACDPKAEPPAPGGFVSSSPPLLKVHSWPMAQKILSECCGCCRCHVLVLSHVADPVSGCHRSMRRTWSQQRANMIAEDRSELTTVKRRHSVAALYAYSGPDVDPET